MRALLVSLAIIGACSPMNDMSRPMDYLSDAAVRPRQIIAMVGQSNVPGRKFIEQVSDATKRALYGSNLDTVTLREWEATSANPPVVLYNTADQSGTQTPVRADGPLSPRPYALPQYNMGPELSMGRFIDGITHGFALVKFSIGGTSLAVNWDPTGTYPTGTNLFDQMVAYLQAAETDLGGYIAGIVWIQGESDGTDSAQAAAYEANLTALIAALRVTWPGLPFVFNRLSTSSVAVYKTDIRTAQENVATGDAATWLVDSDGLALDSGLHFVSDSYIDLGLRLGPAVIAALGLTIPLEPEFSYLTDELDVTFTDQSVNPNVGGIPVAQLSVASWAWNFGDGNTSTSQNPSHTYAADGAYTVTLIVRDAAGVSAQQVKTITVAAATWTVDATSNRGRPITSAEWSALIAAHGLTAGGATLDVPDHLFLFDEASGSILDKIGSKNLTVGNSPSRGIAVSGWTATAIGASGAGTTQTASNTTLPNINADEIACLGYIRYASGSTNREILALGGAAANSVQARGGTTGIRKRTGSNSANGSLDHTGQVRPYLSSRSIAESTDLLHTNIEKLSLTWASASGTTLTATFCSSADVGISADFLYLAVCAGGNWSRMTDEERAHLLSALGWEVTGY